ncbi:hypothetical protein BDV98DRAFT_387382 [Pterulicium gracile]|uniref:Extracellular membrane protein CFEM domain-containing protein n=1 Tax=Pterulicium gracile TaxID=1884261 RepID=A0A5C3QYR5_9AGAR|nr:hypothetical protein BDV98DRAFT_387382 [Pterula gracilis]
MVAFKSIFVATVLAAVTIASAASVPVSKRQDAPRLNPFGDLSLNDIPERCREPCDDAVELANNAQCLSNFACLCNGDDDEVDDIGECFSCVVRHTADEQRRPQILEIGRGILSEYHQICNGAGHPVPEGTLADDGKYNDNDSDSGDDRDDNNDSANEWDDDNNDDGRNSGDDNDDDLADDVDSNDGGSNAGDDIDDDGHISDDDHQNTTGGGYASENDDWHDINDSGNESDDDDGPNSNVGGGSGTSSGGNKNGGGNDDDGSTNSLNTDDGETGAASALRTPAAAALVGSFLLGALTF